MNTLVGPMDYLRALLKGTPDDPLGLEPVDREYHDDPAIPPPPDPLDPNQPTPYAPGYRQPVG